MYLPLREDYRAALDRLAAAGNAGDQIADGSGVDNRPDSDQRQGGFSGRAYDAKGRRHSRNDVLVTSIDRSRTGLASPQPLENNRPAERKSTPSNYGSLVNFVRIAARSSLLPRS